MREGIKMILIFGGAYQGKLEYAKKNFDIDTVCDCMQESCEPDFTTDAVCGIEAFTLQCVKEGVNPVEWFAAREGEWADKVLIICDVSQGVVPIDPQIRAFREANSRLMLYLAGKAKRVIRVFCGIGKDM